MRCDVFDLGNGMYKIEYTARDFAVRVRVVCAPACVRARSLCVCPAGGAGTAAHHAHVHAVGGLER